MCKKKKQQCKICGNEIILKEKNGRICNTCYKPFLYGYNKGYNKIYKKIIRGKNGQNTICI